MTDTKPYDITDHLRTPEEMAKYLIACVQEGTDDAAFLRKAVGDVVAAATKLRDPVDDRERLRELVDVVWNEATESTAVPDTPWADRLIDKVYPSLAASVPVAGEAIAGYMVGTDYFRPDVLAAARIYAENRGLTVRPLVYGDAAPQASAEYDRGHADGWAAGWDQAIKQPQADKDGGQQRAGDAFPDYMHDLRYHDQFRIGWNRCVDAYRAALSATQAEQGERN